MMHVGSKLVFYSLSVAIFTKTSQIFLGLKSAYDLGIYTVAATLGTSFYFVLVALISSFMTDIYQEKSLEESQKKVARLNALVIFISIGAFVFFFALWAVDYQSIVWRTVSTGGTDHLVDGRCLFIFWFINSC
jgi:O-antigen/teichoic acid export membrane protein